MIADAERPKMQVVKLDCYRSIDDLPVKNWFKIQETDDISYLLKTNEVLNEEQKKELNLVFEDIYREFINLFGISDDLYTILSLRREIAVLKLDLYLNSDPSIQTFIDIAEQQLQSVLAKHEKTTVHQLKASVEKYMGFRIDDKTVTVKEFYAYIELIKGNGE